MRSLRARSLRSRCLRAGCLRSRYLRARWRLLLRRSGLLARWLCRARRVVLRLLRLLRTLGWRGLTLC